MTYGVLHRNANRIIVPPFAIKSNFDFMLSKDEKVMNFSDGTSRKVSSWKEVHVLSEEFRSIVLRIYGMMWHEFVLIWYSRVGERIESMSWIYVEFN
jgi:hypothetical protein